MFPAPFDYYKPAALSEAIQMLTALGGDAKLLAGGQSLIPALKLRPTSPQHLIDLSGIAELNQIGVEDNTLIIGAMVTHWQIESSPVVRNALPYLSKVAALIADPQVRNRGTIGGSVVNSDPAADYPASIVTLWVRPFQTRTSSEPGLIRCGTSRRLVLPKAIDRVSWPSSFFASRERPPQIFS